MNKADLTAICELEKALALSIKTHQGRLNCPEVVSISQQLDRYVVKLMRERRES